MNRKGIAAIVICILALALFPDALPGQVDPDVYERAAPDPDPIPVPGIEHGGQERVDRKYAPHSTMSAWPKHWASCW